MMKFYLRKNRERKCWNYWRKRSLFCRFLENLVEGEKSKSNFFTKVAFTKILIGISF
ncbi:hypothetical protein TFUB22_02178 [Tannerella forsythia]|nr:hypothetical protein TFUB22_02178 [Tannerella forsythia]